MNTGMIMLTVLVTVATSEAKDLQVNPMKYDPNTHTYKSEGMGLKMQPVIAGFVLGLFLFVFDMVSPTVNKYLTILILITVLLTNGQYLINALPTQKG